MNLTGADLSDVNLTRTTLTNTVFTDAILTGLTAATGYVVDCDGTNRLERVPVVTEAGARFCGAGQTSEWLCNLPLYRRRATGPYAADRCGA